MSLPQLKINIRKYINFNILLSEILLVYSTPKWLKAELLRNNNSAISLPQVTIID